MLLLQSRKFASYIFCIEFFDPQRASCSLSVTRVSLGVVSISCTHNESFCGLPRVGEDGIELWESAAMIFATASTGAVPAKRVIPYSRW
jgi:hypothetical protein